MPVIASMRAGVRKQRVVGGGSYTTIDAAQNDLGVDHYAQKIKPSSAMVVHSVHLRLNVNGTSGVLTVGISSTIPSTSVTYVGGTGTVDTAGKTTTTGLDVVLSSPASLAGGVDYWLVVFGTVAGLQPVAIQSYTGLIVTGFSPNPEGDNKGGDMLFGTGGYGSATTSYRLLFSVA